MGARGPAPHVLTFLGAPKNASHSGSVFFLILIITLIVLVPMRFPRLVGTVRARFPILVALGTGRISLVRCM